ncbi:hypothetical protein Tco_0867162, partial [Tanacetum coccineum]
LQKGSLGNVLYGVGAVSGLYWGTSLNIAHGIALALAYVPNDGLTFWGYEWDTHDTCSESVFDVQVKPRRNFRAYSGGTLYQPTPGIKVFQFQHHWFNSRLSWEIAELSQSRKKKKRRPKKNMAVEIWLLQHLSANVQR